MKIVSEEKPMLTELNLRGMHCTACKNLIEAELEEIPGVVSIQVDLAGERARVEYHEEQVALNTLIDKIAELGYQAEAAQ
jgi:copper chaperone CopZ